MARMGPDKRNFGHVQRGKVTHHNIHTSTDNLDHHVYRAQLRHLNNAHQGRHSALLSTIDRLTQGRFHLLNLGHDILLRCAELNFRVSDHFHLYASRRKLPPLRHFMDDQAWR